jgi:outer membrane murein-binding lipoprotein Lpp
MRKLNPFVIAGLLVCATTMWGCNQQKSGTIATKIRELETRYAKLEEDYKTLQATNDQTRKKFSAIDALRVALENDKQELSKQLETLKADREAFRKQAAERTLERDTAQNNLSQFCKELHTLVGKMEATVNPNSNAAAPIIPASRRND